MDRLIAGVGRIAPGNRRGIAPARRGRRPAPWNSSGAPGGAAACCTGNEVYPAGAAEALGGVASVWPT